MADTYSNRFEPGVVRDTRTGNVVSSTNPKYTTQDRTIQRPIYETRFDVEAYNRFVAERQKQLEENIARQKQKREQELARQEEARAKASALREKKFATFETNKFLAERGKAARGRTEKGRSKNLVDVANQDIVSFANQETERAKRESEEAKSRFTTKKIIGYETVRVGAEQKPSPISSGQAAQDQAKYNTEKIVYAKIAGAYVPGTYNVSKQEFKVLSGTRGITQTEPFRITSDKIVSGASQAETLNRQINLENRARENRQVKTIFNPQSFPIQDNSISGVVERGNVAVLAEQYAQKSSIANTISEEDYNAYRKAFADLKTESDNLQTRIDKGLATQSEVNDFNRKLRETRNKYSDIEQKISAVEESRSMFESAYAKNPIQPIVGDLIPSKMEPFSLGSVADYLLGEQKTYATAGEIGLVELRARVLQAKKQGVVLSEKEKAEILAIASASGYAPTYEKLSLGEQQDITNFVRNKKDVVSEEYSKSAIGGAFELTGQTAYLTEKGSESPYRIGGRLTRAGLELAPFYFTGGALGALKGFSLGVIGEGASEATFAYTKDPLLSTAVGLTTIVGGDIALKKIVNTKTAKNLLGYQEQLTGDLFLGTRLNSSGSSALKKEIETGLKQIDFAITGKGNLKVVTFDKLQRFRGVPVPKEIPVNLKANLRTFAGYEERALSDLFKLEKPVSYVTEQGKTLTFKTEAELRKALRLMETNIFEVKGKAKVGEKFITIDYLLGAKGLNPDVKVFEKTIFDQVKSSWYKQAGGYAPKSILAKNPRKAIFTESKFKVENYFEDIPKFEFKPIRNVKGAIERALKKPAKPLKEEFKFKESEIEKLSQEEIFKIGKENKLFVEKDLSIKNKPDISILGEFNEKTKQVFINEKEISKMFPSVAKQEEKTLIHELTHKYDLGIKNTKNIFSEKQIMEDFDKLGGYQKTSEMFSKIRSAYPKEQYATEFLARFAEEFPEQIFKPTTDTGKYLNKIFKANKGDFDRIIYQRQTPLIELPSRIEIGKDVLKGKVSSKFFEDEGKTLGKIYQKYGFSEKLATGGRFRARFKTKINAAFVPENVGKKLKSSIGIDYSQTDKTIMKLRKEVLRSELAQKEISLATNKIENELAKAAKSIAAKTETKKQSLVLYGGGVFNQVRVPVDEYFEEYSVIGNKQIPSASVLDFARGVEKNRFNLPAKSLSKSISKSISKSLDKNISKTLDKSLEKSLDKSLEKSISKPVNKTLDRSLEKSLDKSLEKSLEKQLEKTLEKTTEKTLDKLFPRINLERIGKPTPLFGKSLIQTTEKKKSSLKPAYNLYVRRSTPKGKSRVKVLLVEKGLPFNLAVNKGSSIVDKYSDRTFILQKQGTTKRKDIDSLPSLRKFRYPKGKTQLRKYGRLTFVEKSKFAIDSREEKEGIPYKAARQRKKRKSR